MRSVDVKFIYFLSRLSPDLASFIVNLLCEVKEKKKCWEIFFLRAPSDRPGAAHCQTSRVLNCTLHLLFIEHLWCHQVSIRGNVVGRLRRKREGGDKKGRLKLCACVSGKRIWLNRNFFCCDFGKLNRYSMTFHIKILLHFQFGASGRGNFLIAVWNLFSKINDVRKKAQLASQQKKCVLFILARKTLLVLRNAQGYFAMNAKQKKNLFKDPHRR
jgi:hypothetical protein